MTFGRSFKDLSNGVLNHDINVKLKYLNLNVPVHGVGTKEIDH